MKYLFLILLTATACFGQGTITGTRLNIGAGDSIINGNISAKGTLLNLGGGVTALETRYYEPSAGGASYFSFKAPALAGNVQLTWPNAAPSAGQFFGDANGDGVMDWTGSSTGGNGAGDSDKLAKFDASGFLRAERVFSDGNVEIGLANTADGVLTLRSIGSSGRVNLSIGANDDEYDWTFPLNVNGTVASQEWAGNASNLTSGTVAAARLGTGTTDSGTVLHGDNTWSEVGDVFLGSSNAFTAQGNSFAFSPRWTFNALSGVTVSTTSTLQVGAAYEGSVSANHTFVFSGTPASGDTILTVLSVTNSPVLTIPSSRRAGEADSGITNVQLTAGKHWLQWTYDGTVWILRDSLAAVITVANGGTGVSSLTAYAPIFGGTTSTGAVQSGTVGTAGQVLTSNGAGALPTFQNAASGGASISTFRQNVFLWEEYMQEGSLPASPVGPLGLVRTVSGTGASLTGSALDVQTAPGAVQFTTGTTTTGYASHNANTTATRLGGGTYKLEARIYMPALVDGTDSGTVRFGFIDSTTGTDGTDGVFFRYSNANANWILVARTNSVETTTTTTSAPSAATWYKLRIEVNAAATSAEFFIDGSSVGTVTGLPSATVRYCGPGISIVKSAGTTARTLLVDYIGMEIGLTASR